MKNLNNSTRWVVNFNDQNNKKITNKRVLIEYYPIKNKFIFTGQLKIGDYQFDFSKREFLMGEKNIGYTDITNEPITYNFTVDDLDIDDYILKVYDELESNVETHKVFSEKMKEYKNLRVGDEEDFSDIPLE